MILENLKPRLLETLIKATETNTPVEMPLIYNELLTHDKIYSVFEFMFNVGMDFETRKDEFRYVIIVKPFWSKDILKYIPMVGG